MCACGRGHKHCTINAAHRGSRKFAAPLITDEVGYQALITHL
jgi:hypothetical protein